MNNETKTSPPRFFITASTTTTASSMALTALFLISALFFLAFFSICARRLLSPSSSTHLRRSPLPISNPNRNRGVDPEILKAMTVVRIERGEEWCVVCLGELAEKEMVKVIAGCGHGFHPACIDAWLGIHGSCPLCRCTEILEFGDGDGGGEEKRRAMGRSRSGEWSRIERTMFLRRTCSF
ncbi:Zinc finger RING/FYVE/PHD-type protein [Dioscorea alata]|uniref:Zinc finger RING/FYVE/PHD-type protein n=1 Tax=Dioscorea alata TaxID=55571 RepID=A0ACB7WRG7_DIOAL|nr:Zinc finger RING/FYVE/PHD-type protein [Dioscorea alata]